MGQLFPYQFAPLKPLGFDGNAITTSDAVTLSVPAGAQGALIQASGGNINWTDNGVDPTSAAGGGMVLTADAEPSWFPVGLLETLSFIAVGSSTFLLVSYYG